MLDIPEHRLGLREYQLSGQKQVRNLFAAMFVADRATRLRPV